MSSRSSSSLCGAVLLLVLMIFTFINASQACKCAPDHHQNTFCKAAYAMRATVRSALTPVTRRRNLLEFTVEILNDFRNADLPRLNEGEFLHTRIITQKDPGLCGGVRLKEDVEYLITGNSDNDGVPRLTLCDWFEEWQRLPNETVAALRGGFDCSCAVIRCSDPECGGNNDDGYCKVYGGFGDYEPGCLCHRVSVEAGCQWNRAACNGSATSKSFQRQLSGAVTDGSATSSTPSSTTTSRTTATKTTTTTTTKTTATTAATTAGAAATSSTGSTRRLPSTKTSQPTKYSNPASPTRSRTDPSTDPALAITEAPSDAIDPGVGTTDPPLHTTDEPYVTTEEPQSVSTEFERTLTNTSVVTTTP